MGGFRISARGKACAWKGLACLAMMSVPALAQPATEEKAPAGAARTSAASAHSVVPATDSGGLDPKDPAEWMRQLRKHLEGLTLPEHVYKVSVSPDPWPINAYLGNFMNDMIVPRRPPSKAIESWGGSRPSDEGAFGNGHPLDLTVLAIEDYLSRGSSGPVHEGALRCADAIAEAWKQPHGGSLLFLPWAKVLKDGDVTPGQFTGAFPFAFWGSDMVVFIGHGSPQGPWLGDAGEDALMVPDNYNWSGGQAKWFVNSSCKGLYDGRCCGEPDSNLLTFGNQGRDRAGHSVPEWGGWGKAMGLGTGAKDRLHAIFGFRSMSWFNCDRRRQERSWECPRVLEPHLGRHWEAYPAYTFIKALMCSEKTLAEQGLPTGMGDLWMYCANFQYRMTGVSGSAPAVHAYQAEVRDEPSRVLLDYYDESFHAPFPSPGRLGDAHVLVLKCRTQVFGTPEF